MDEELPFRPEAVTCAWHRCDASFPTFAAIYLRVAEARYCDEHRLLAELDRIEVEHITNLDV